VLHKTMRRVTEDVEVFKFNTAVAALMEFTNALGAHLEEQGATPTFEQAAETLILMLAPFAPHIAEELWARRGGDYSVHQQSWPVYDPTLAADETLTLVVQVNGKLRDRLPVPAGISDEEARQRALESERVQEYLHGGQPKRVIVVPVQLVNFVL
jgi:leucyl-tRNA synthetase